MQRTAALKISMSVSAPSGPEGKFADSHLKIQRAKIHLYELTRLIDSHEKANEPQITFDPDQIGPDGKRLAHLHVHAVALPPQSAAIIGDALHNLRAALDLLTVRLVELNGKVATNRIEFPFAKTEEELESKRRRHHLHLMADSDWAELKGLKPFEGGDELLTALHGLDILDKHRRLIPNGTRVGTPNVGPKIDPITQKPFGFDEDDVRMEITPGARAKVEFTFPKGEPLGEQPLKESLRSLIKLVESILDRFEKLHPE